MTYNANEHKLEAVEPKYYARIPNMAVEWFCRMRQFSQTTTPA